MKLRADLKTLLCVFAMLVAVDLTGAQRSDRGGKPTPESGVRVEPEDAGVAWFGTWAGALAEASRTRRPILLMSAAPACREVPGVW
jgi:hypothetical protein